MDKKAICKVQEKIEDWYKHLPNKIHRFLHNIPLIAVYFFIIVVSVQHPIRSDWDIIILFALMVVLAVLLFVFPWNKFDPIGKKEL